MITLLSPAKKLLQFEHVYAEACSEPRFPDMTQQLVAIMREKSEADIASLMHLSPNLARLNWERYQHFAERDVPMTQSYPAVLYFQGDVYQSLQASSWSEKTMVYAQDHLLILSGLYGLLRPLDRMQAYRLEMGTRLANPKGENLYDFWKEAIVRAINLQASAQSNPGVVNLASGEYFKSVHTNALEVPLLEVQFKEDKNGSQKTIGIFAKKARGLMAKYIMEAQVDSFEGLKAFHGNDYHFDPSQSSEHAYIFVRKHR